MTATTPPLTHRQSLYARLRAECAPPARPRVWRTRRRSAPPPMGSGRVINSPDWTRSAFWSGSSTAPENATIFAGPACRGDVLFLSTFVLADSPEQAQALARALGMRAQAVPLGRYGSIGVDADRLYHCFTPRAPSSP
jgi:hypothetical protein